MPTYTPPPGNNAPLGLTGDYTPPPGAQAQINVGDTVAATVSPNRDIPFLGPAAAAKPNDVLIALGTAVSRPGAILEIDTIGDGQGFDSNVFTSSSLPPISLGTGESVGHANRQLKDRRLYGNLIGLQNPFSLGLAFLTESLPSWPSGYTTTGVVTHFYSGAWGIPLKTAVQEALVLPAFVLTDVFGGGEVAVPVYSAVPGVIGGASGEALGIIVGVTFEGVGFTTAAGEGLSPAITTDRRLAAALSHGQSVAVDLKIESTVTTAGTGESVVMTLDVYDLVAPRYGVGEDLTTDLATSVMLDELVETGEELTVDLESAPASYFEIEFGTGEETEASLRTATTLALDFAAGESVEPVEFTLPVRPPFAFELGGGERFSANLSTALNLGAIRLSDGQSVNVGYVETPPPIKFTAGESLSFVLGTQVSIGAHLYDGQAGGAEELDIRLPAFMAAELWTGEDITYLSMKIQVSSYFHCALFDGVYITATEQTSTTTYDLADPVLYVDTLQWLTDMNAFEFIEMRPSFQYNKGPGILVTVDLQTRPALHITFATGESWALEANARYLGVDLVAPTAAIYPSEFFYTEPVTHLCYPNVFPAADAMEVELDFKDESCYADYMFTGQSMEVVLSANYRLPWKGMGTGERFSFDFTMPAPWRVGFRSGQMITVSLATKAVMSTEYFQGESVELTFQEPDAEFVTGESVVATLHTTYDVEFLERGCLENEYRYVKPDGFEDVEKFNPVAVELEPFAHDIKARCF